MQGRSRNGARPKARSGTAVKKQNSGMLTKLLYKVLANQEISMECFISSKFYKERTHGMMMSLI